MHNVLEELMCTLVHTSHRPPTGFASHPDPVILCKVSIIGGPPKPHAAALWAPCGSTLPPWTETRSRAQLLCSLQFVACTLHCALCIYLTAGSGVVASSFQHNEHQTCSVDFLPSSELPLIPARGKRHRFLGIREGKVCLGSFPGLLGLL